MQNKLLRILIFSLAFLLIFQFFSGKKKDVDIVPEDISISAGSEFALGKEVILKITNNTKGPVVIPQNCPKNPLTVEEYQNGEWVEKSAEIDPDFCENTEAVSIEASKTYPFSFGRWGWSLFDETGRYRVSFKTILDDKERVYSHEFAVTSPSLFRQFWVNVFYRPIFNTLILLISIMPGHSLGWGIILLTLIIKLILLGPNHKALKAQKQMQKVQPQLDALKIKYKDDPQKLARETMEVWKKYKVSPMSSCLPILIQFPVLIALFYVVKAGLGNINPDLLYSTLGDFDLHAVSPTFLGIIDLTKLNVIVLPIIVGGLQFLQMRLTLAKSKSMVPAKKDGPNPMPMMNNMMQYFMPLMIAFFTASLPAAVGFYWGTSTLFGIGQQIIVNRSKD